MMDLCRFSEGVSSEFARISDIPYTIRPKKPPLLGVDRQQMSLASCNVQVWFTQVQFAAQDSDRDVAWDWSDDAAESLLVAKWRATG